MIILLVIIVVVVIILLYFIYYWYFSANNTTDNIIPTLHAKCNEVGCGGNLVCDSTCDRCRQTLNSPCANDIDCTHGLHCIDWICGDNKIAESDNLDHLDTLDQLPMKPPTIRWADEYK